MLVTRSLISSQRTELLCSSAMALALALAFTALRYSQIISCIFCHCTQADMDCLCHVYLLSCQEIKNTESHGAM